MSAADRAQSSEQKAPDVRPGRTYAELYCARTAVLPENYVRAVFRQTLYRRVLPLVPVLQLFFRDYFAPDYDFIAGVGLLRDPEHLAGEIIHFHHHVLNRGFLRNGLRLRVSVWRMGQLAGEVMVVKGETAGPANLLLSRP